MKKPSIPDVLSSTIKDMMAKRTIDEITVKEILDACGISRPSFYRYFYDKQALVEYVFQKELADPFFWDFTKDLRAREARFLRHLRKSRSFYINALKSTGQNSLYQIWLDQGIQSIERYFRSLAEFDGISDSDLHFFSKYLAYAYVNMDIEWLVDPSPVSAEEMARKMELMVTGGIQGILAEAKRESDKQEQPNPDGL